MDRLNEKLDTIAQQLAEIKEAQAVNNAHLAEHMRRTAMLEEAIKPIQVHVAFMNAAAKIFSVGIAVGGLVVGVLKVLHG